MSGGAPRLVVRHPRLATFALVLVLIGGTLAFRALPRRRDPRVVVPVAAVVCPYPGAAASDADAHVALPLERALHGLAGVERIESVAQDNLAALRVYVDERLDDPRPVFDALERRLHDVPLPDGAGPVRVLRDEGETSSLLLAVSASTIADAAAAAEQLAGALRATPETASARLVGAPEPSVEVELDTARLLRSGLPVPELIDTLASEPLPLPGEPPDPATAKVFANDDALRRTPIGVAASGPVRLEDIATLRDVPLHVTFPVTLDGAPAVLVDVRRRDGTRVDAFAHATAAARERVERDLSPKVTVRVLSDESQQVDDALGLFLRSLAEAIGLVILVALAGFREFRSALLLALAIPVTLALTFALLLPLGVDLQEVSLASLILALGLLVDDPVVAGDAIRRELDAGVPPREAAWRGPVRLSRAILFATLTNVVAYLPLLLVPGNVGRFIHTLPLVLTASLVASRIVSMTFVPLFGAWIFRGRRPPEAEPDTRAYRVLARWAVRRRWLVLAVATAGALAGLVPARQLAPQFFPRDLSTLSYVDVWLPQRTPPGAAADAAARLLDTARGATARTGVAIASVQGRAAPRFWFSLDPPPPQPRYAQFVIVAQDPSATDRLVGPLQRALDRDRGPALADVRQLEIGKPVGVPVQVRIAGASVTELEDAARRVEDALARVASARGVRDDWGLRPAAAPAPADLRGLPGSGLRLAAAEALGGLPLGILRDGRIVRLHVDAALRARLAEALGPSGAHDAPTPGPPVLARRDGGLAITVACFPVPGALPSIVLRDARPALDRIATALPRGVTLALGGEDEEQRHGFAQLGRVLALSLALIVLALALQFRGLVQPLLVLAALPFGAAGALLLLAATGTPFGFMAFLGLASLAGVIVSHVIVLFDGIETLRHDGVPLEDALVQAGSERLRPVLVTVAATVLALGPLLWRGGPLWRPLCIAQLGGLTLATLVTLVLVPVLYAIAALDFKALRFADRSG